MELEKMKWSGKSQLSPELASQKIKEDFMKMPSLSKLFIACVLLCTPIIASNAQAPNARKSSISSGNSVITCMPGFVLRCTSSGCFCVKP
jgi:hypothetical protein